MLSEELKEYIKTNIEYQLKNIKNLQFKDLRVLLYNYNKYLERLKIIDDKIETLKKISGCTISSVAPKDVNVQKSSIYVDALEKKENEIEALSDEKIQLCIIIDRINCGLKLISEEPYKDIIKLKYIDKKSIDEILEMLHISRRTYDRHHNRLMSEIKSLFLL